MAEKMTKMEMFATLKETIKEIEGVDETLVEFLDKEMAALTQKAEKAKERAAKKKAEGDALKEAIVAVLTEEMQTVDDIVAQIEGEDVSKQKIVVRLTQLVKDGVAERGTEKVDGKQRAAYCLTGASEEVEAEEEVTE